MKCLGNIWDMLGKLCLGIFWRCLHGAFWLAGFKDEAEDIGQKLMLRDVKDLRLLSETLTGRLARLSLLSHLT